MASGIELLQHSPNTNIIGDLIDFYDDEWKVIEHLSIEATKDDMEKDQKVQMDLIADDRTNRIAVPQVFCRVAKLLKVEDFEAVLTFLVTKACLDPNEEVRRAGSEAAVAIIKAQANKHASSVLKILESFLAAETGLAAKEGSKNEACILLSKLAPYLSDISQKKLVVTFEMLIELAYSS